MFIARVSTRWIFAQQLCSSHTDSPSSNLAIWAMLNSRGLKVLHEKWFFWFIFGSTFKITSVRTPFILKMLGYVAVFFISHTSFCPFVTAHFGFYMTLFYSKSFLIKIMFRELKRHAPLVLCRQRRHEQFFTTFDV